MGIGLFIAGCVIAVIALGYAIYDLVTLVKSQMTLVDYKAKILKYVGLGAAFIVGIVLLCIGIPLWLNWNLVGWEYASVIIGSFFTGLCIYLSLVSFILHYYGKNLPKALDKVLFIVLAVSFPLIFVMIFVLSNGYANHLVYPLINGIRFDGNLATPEGYSPNIAFYAICILTGAIYTYFLCDHKFYMQYGKHGILESTFMVAFPAGVIGARLFYVIGEWDKFASNPINAFKIWEGGLTVIGGALTGIVVGVLWFLWRNKKYNIWLAVDIILPTILLAQAVGRWGNFFNCEVHGVETSVVYWRWLPLIIQKNSAYSSSLGWASEGNIYVPLFLIESLVNFLGLFVLSHLFGNALRKYTKLGDIAFGYFIWYGFTRVFMEPLRDKSFNMGKDGYWSWIWSVAFIVGGALLILINHIVRYYLDKKKGKEVVTAKNKIYSLIQIPIIIILSLPLITIGFYLISNTQFQAELVLNNFNTGLVLVCSGFALFLFSIMPIIKLTDAYMLDKGQANA